MVFADLQSNGLSKYSKIVLLALLIAFFALIVGVQYVNAQSADINKGVSFWCGKVNQHVSGGQWTTDPDGVSGCPQYSAYTDSKLSYCQQFYPNTDTVRAAGQETIPDWRNRGNWGSFTATKQTYECLQTNEPPNASDDSYSVKEGDRVSGNVLSNDSDPDGDTLSVDPRDFERSSFGSWIDVNRDGSFEFEADQNVSGSFTRTYQVSDGNGGTDQASVSIDVNASADADISKGVSFWCGKVNQHVSGGQWTTDPDGVSGCPQYSAYTDSKLSYCQQFYPNTDTVRAAGQETIPDWRNRGNWGSFTATKQTYECLQTNEPPNASDDSYSVKEGDRVSGNVLSNDSDPDGDTLSVDPRDFERSSFGSWIDVNRDGSFEFEADQNVSGSFTRTYQVSDGNGGTDQADLTITVEKNQLPVACVNSSRTDVFCTGDESDGSVEAPDPIQTVTEGYTRDFHTCQSYDPDGRITDYSGEIISGPGYADTFGGCTVDLHIPLGSVERDTRGEASVTVIDNSSDTATRDKVYFDVENSEVRDDSIKVVPGETREIDVMSNDEGAQRITDVGTPQHGQATELNNGYRDDSIQYTADPNHTGSDSFKYTVEGSNGGTDSATVDVTIGEPNEPPVASDDYYQTFEGKSLGVSVPGVLGNDTDSDGSVTSASVVSEPSDAQSFNLNANGSFTYDPGGDETNDSFTYRANDNDGSSDQATANITVKDADPTASDDSYSTPENSTLTVSAPGVLGNDTNTGPGSLEVSPITSANSQPSNGSVTFNSDGSFTYEPNRGFDGTDTFVYQLTDGYNPSENDAAQVTVNVNSNPSPTAHCDVDKTTITGGGFVGFDGTKSTDDGSIEDYSWDFDNGSSGSGSTASEYYTNSGTYNPSLTVTDDDGGSNRVECPEITVQETPDADDDNYTAESGSELTVSSPGVLVNDSDADGSIVSSALQSGPTDAVNFDYNSDGSFTYNPGNDTTDDSFTYKIVDNDGLSDQATVSIAVNDPPQATIKPSNPPAVVNQTFLYQSKSSDSDGSIDNYEWDTDNDGNYETTGPTVNQITQTYTATGSESVSLRVTDNDGSQDTDTATINVVKPSFELEPSSQRIWVGADANIKSTIAVVNVTNIIGPISPSDISFTVDASSDLKNQLGSQGGIETTYDANSQRFELKVDSNANGLKAGQYDIDVEAGVPAISSVDAVTTSITLNAEQNVEF